MPLRYSSNFWRLLKTPLIKCKVELKPMWTKDFILGEAHNGNTNENPNNIIFTIKNYVSVVTLSAKDNQKLPKYLSKVFEKLVYWNEYKTKSDNKNTTNKYR